MNNTEIIYFYPYKLFKQNNQNYLFASKTGGIYSIDEKVLTLLKFENSTCEELYNAVNRDSSLGSVEEYEELIQNFEKFNIMKTESTERYFKSLCDLDYNFSCIELMIVQDCNLRCVYCYGEGGNYNDKGIMTVEVAKDAINYLMENSKKKDVSVVFFGGEPLINFSLIKEMVDYSKEIADKNDKNVTFSITTNATLLNEEISNFLKINDFIVTVSIDGDETIHNANRYYVGKRGSYNNAIKGINNLKQDQVATVARATLEPKSMNMLKTVDHLIHEIGFGTLYMSPCINMFKEYEDFTSLKSEYDKLLEMLDLCLEKKNYKELTLIKNLYKELRKVHKGSIRSRFCGAAKNMIAIDKNGHIYPCQRFVSNKDYIIGDVKKGIDIDKYNDLMKNEMALSSREGCDKCWAATLCGGGCPNENLAANGVPNKPIQQYCEVTKHFMQNIILRYLKLNEEEKEALFANM